MTTNEIEKELTEAGRKISKACEELGTSLNKAAEEFRKVFGAAAASLPGWYVDSDYWKYEPKTEEKLTRDQAFKGICKRKRKGGRRWDL